MHQFNPFNEAALLSDAEMLAAVTAMNRQIHALAPVLNSPTVADAVTVASRSLEGIVWSLGMPAERVFYLPNGAEPAGARGGEVRRELGLADRPVVLLYTRFAEFDPARALEVLRRVRADVPGVALLVVGRALVSADDARFDRLAHEWGLADSVVRAGWVPPEGLSAHLAAADAALFPYDDTLVNRTKCSAKLIELLAAGVPVVADDVGQNREYIVAGQTGCLTPPGDVEAMAASLVALLRDANARRRLGAAAARRMGMDFTWEGLAHRALVAYGADAMGS